MTFRLENPNALIIIEPLGPNAFKVITKEKLWNADVGHHVVNGPATIQLNDLVELHSRIETIIRQARA